MTIQRIAYRGWQDCLLISNKIVEAIAVPAIGRVMQFRFAGEQAGPFWENEELDGRGNKSRDKDNWLNYGGDKTWPSPQAEWEKYVGRTWPPPDTFDPTPYKAAVESEEIQLTSQIAPQYGIRAVRRVRLVGNAPQMEITTEFQKVTGAPVRVGVWVITQLRDPERVLALLPERTELRDGYVQQMGIAPREARRDGRILSLKRDTKKEVKVGTEATALLWMDDHFALRICAEDSPGEYPDGGSRTEIYTNPDPLRYVELETQGPLATLKPGERIARTNTYTLYRRTTRDSLLEARRLFGID